MNNKIIGYTTGAFDLFHIGHLNILRKAKEQCDKLIVGVSSDELIEKYKKIKPIIPFADRFAIVSSIRYVDITIEQTSLDKYKAWKKIKYNRIFVGNDWLGDTKWVALEENLKKHGAKVIYLPYTNNISTTKIRELIEKK
jgi:glycerol-3-phosphate cytidylyltransferase